MAENSTIKQEILDNVTNATTSNLTTKDELASILNKTNENKTEDSVTTGINTRLTTAEGTLTTTVSRLPPAGGSTNQVLTKTSNQDYHYDWETPTSGTGGLTQSQVDARILPRARTGDTGTWAKNKLPSDTVYSAAIANFRSEAQINQLIASGVPNNRRIPAGGTQGQVLAKESNTDFDMEYITIIGLPAGGTDGQLLERTATGYRWIDKPGGTTPTPGQSDDVYLVAGTAATFPGVTGATGQHFSNTGSLVTNYPTITQDSYVFFAQPAADNDINSVGFLGGIEQFATLQKLAATSTINSVLFMKYGEQTTTISTAGSGVAVTIGRPV